MSKVTLEQFVKCLRIKLAPSNIPVIVVRPGSFTAATAIRANEYKLLKEMWNAMDDKKRRRDNDFWQTSRMICQAQQLIAEKDAPCVVATLEETHVARYPRTAIKVSNWSPAFVFDGMSLPLF